jgi:hypothetical protein
MYASQHLTTIESFICHKIPTEREERKKEVEITSFDIKKIVL